MRFMPSIVKVRELIADGAIGEIQSIAADFGFRAEFDPENRVFDPALGGGALLDVGISPLSLAHMLLGEPETVLGTALIGETGVDEESMAILGYDGGRQAVLRMAVRLETPFETTILGTKGSIRIPSKWWRSESIVVSQEDRGERTIDLPTAENGFIYQVEEFMDLIRGKRLESDIISLDESLSIMRTMDRIRERWGLKYPMEK